jgi:hypothetical protein
LFVPVAELEEALPVDGAAEEVTVHATA